MNQGKSIWPHALYYLAAFSQQLLTDLVGEWRHRSSEVFCISIREVLSAD